MKTCFLNKKKTTIFWTNNVSRCYAERGCLSFSIEGEQSDATSRTQLATEKIRLNTDRITLNENRKTRLADELALSCLYSEPLTGMFRATAASRQKLVAISAIVSR